MIYPKTQMKIKEYMHDDIFKGAVYAFIQKEDEEIKAIGLAQVVPFSKEMDRNLLFDVASLTKVICTTTVILQLVEEGVIELDDSLIHYLPSFQDSKVTIRHLLTHTSAIDSYIPQRDCLSAKELRQAFYQLKSTEKIGQEVVYTDTGMILLGFLLEEYFQEDLQIIFKKRVLQPLEMNDSTFGPVSPTKTVPTEMHPIRGLIHGEVHDPKAYTLGRHCGSAGLFANITDLLLFVHMLLKKGHLPNNDIFLKEETVKELLKDQTPTGNLNRSLGWDLKNDLKTKQPLLFHTGYTGTFMLIDVLNQEAFIFLSSRVHPEDNRDVYLEKRDQIVSTYLKEKAQLN